MDARRTIESLSLESLDYGGSVAFAELGRAIMTLAQYSPKREELGISYSRDPGTDKPVAFWTRRLVDGLHSLATSPWADNSYLMQDVRHPVRAEQGFLRLYLFGSDETVSGLMQGCRVVRVGDMRKLPSRENMEERVRRFHKQPSMRRQINAKTGRATFVRLARSIIEP